MVPEISIYPLYEGGGAVNGNSVGESPYLHIGQWMVEPFISTKGPVISSTTSP